MVCGEMFPADPCRVHAVNGTKDWCMFVVLVRGPFFMYQLVRRSHKSLASVKAVARFNYGRFEITMQKCHWFLSLTKAVLRVTH